MKADIGVENGRTRPSSPSVPDYVPVPGHAALPFPRMAETAADVNRQLPAVPGNDRTAPWPAVVWLGFVAVLIVAVVLAAPGYTSVAAVGLIFGVGLALSGARRAAGLGP